MKTSGLQIEYAKIETSSFLSVAMTLSPSLVLRRLEREIFDLPASDKLWLLAQIAQQLQQPNPEGSSLEQTLMEMANDPQIQQEIVDIEAEFAIAGMDGLSA